jgi:hypothetical protein
MDFTRAHGLTPDVEAAIDDAMEYHEWTPEQIAAGKAIRKIREARMDANSAITHAGKY